MFNDEFQWIHPHEIWDTTHILWVSRRQLLIVKCLLDLHGQDVFKILIHFIF